MAAGELIGCFGLTEPTAGSDPASMVTEAVRMERGWVLNGAKRWIGLASIADVAIIWAKTDDGIRGFVVPTTTSGFTATTITGKLSMRASIQCDITLDVRLPATRFCPGLIGLKGPVLLPERGALRDHVGRHRRRPRRLPNGARYAQERPQFDQPIASFQLTQQKLVDMVLEIQKGPSSRCRPDG